MSPVAGFGASKPLTRCQGPSPTWRGRDVRSPTENEFVRPPYSRLTVTRRFARSYVSLDPRARERCDSALLRLLRDPSDPALRVRRVGELGPYREVRAGFRDRIVIQKEDDSAVLIDVLDFRELLKLDRRLTTELTGPTWPQSTGPG